MPLILKILLSSKLRINLFFTTVSIQPVMLHLSFVYGNIDTKARNVRCIYKALINSSQLLKAMVAMLPNG